MDKYDLYSFNEELIKFLLDGADENQPVINPEKPLETAYSSLMVTPLVEIHSVTIHRRKQSVEERCEIYGRISVVDKQGDTFDIFCRGKDDPELIDLDDGGGGTLSLTYPSAASNGGINVIIPSQYVSLDVLLFEKACLKDLIIAKGEFVLNRTVIDCKGEQVAKCVQGDAGFATVHYAQIQYAVVATVDVFFFDKADDFDLLKNKDISVNHAVDDADNDDCVLPYLPESYDEEDVVVYVESPSVSAHVFGTVTAQSDIPFHASSDCNYSTVLFREPLQQSVPVKSRGSLKLSRSIVAVPAYSSLKIQVDVSHRDTQLPIARSCVDFKPQDGLSFKKDIVGDNGRIRVRVKWSDAYHQLYRERKLKRSNVGALIPEVGDDELEKLPKLCLEQQGPPTMCSAGMSLSMPKVYFEPTPLAEVFSIVVCSRDFKPFSFYGKIAMNSEEIFIFSRDANCPVQSPASGAHVVVGGHSTLTVLDEFSMWTDLKDVTGSTISHGYMHWDELRLPSFVDKHLCSLIRGDKGFAAVHYAIYIDGISANVDVKLDGNPLPVRVHGKLVARSGIQEYPSSYEKEYCQSILFHKEAEDDLPLHTRGSNLPLSKSLVSLSRKSSLILEADLTVSPADSGLPQKASLLKGKLEFRADGEHSFPGKITGEDVYILVSVKFSFDFF